MLTCALRVLVASNTVEGGCSVRVCVGAHGVGGCTERSGAGMGVAFYGGIMSANTAAPTIEELPVNDFALTQTGAAMTIDARIKAAKDKAKSARQAAEKADKEVTNYSRNRREEVRSNDRRALLVGRVVLARAVADQQLWVDLWPDLVAAMNESSDDDRALLGLAPVPIPPSAATEKVQAGDEKAAEKPDDKQADPPVESRRDDAEASAEAAPKAGEKAVAE